MGSGIISYNTLVQSSMYKLLNKLRSNIGCYALLHFIALNQQLVLSREAVAEVNLLGLVSCIVLKVKYNLFVSLVLCTPSA